MKTKTRKAEILYCGDQQKLIKLKTIVSKQTTKEKTANQYCTLLDLSGKKILDYRDSHQQDKNCQIQSLTNIVCYSNFFVKENFYSKLELQPDSDRSLSVDKKQAYQIYTYDGKLIAFSNTPWAYDEKLIKHMENIAKTNTAPDSEQNI